MITQRQAQILAAIIKEYSQTNHPVGSEELLAKSPLTVSSATIRNEMKALEDAGYIEQPHTSAGRVPTDLGYRYFVNKLMRHLDLAAGEQEKLRRELARFQKDYVELGRGICKLLSETSQGAAFALLPESVSTSGFSKIVEQSQDPEEIKMIADFLDELEERGRALTKQNFGQVQTFVDNFSLVVTRVQTPDGRSGLIGIVGPKRMKYERNVSLLEYVSKLLTSGLGFAILFYWR
ncbi:MAG: hypothetical protein Q8R08_02550 [bacterium]|nr:hypothetical protein [bacterium]